jgi:hypothetical protein
MSAVACTSVSLVSQCQTVGVSYIKRHRLYLRDMISIYHLIFACAPMVMSIMLPLACKCEVSLI